MTRYADYHRTVVGYHGTKRETALRIIQREAKFDPSDNDDDWLGPGIYFWEYAPQQAAEWARERKRSKKWTEEIAVLGSMIRLGNCFDLLDPKNLHDLERFHKGYLRAAALFGEKVPKNVRARKWLNCAVFKFAYQAQAFEEPDRPLDTCRAVFVPTDKRTADNRLWDASGLYRDAHVQVCVRNPDCILGTWLVDPLGI